MSRRSLTLLIASIGVIAALALAVLIPVPYVILGPGPTLNTLGLDSSGQPLITISGRTTYPVKGHLNMVTVGYRGGPGVNINVFSALAAWLNPHQAVVPESEVFAPGATQEQTQQVDTQQMTGSQQDATAAALTELHIPYQMQVVVTTAKAGYPAASVLKAGDVITAVDGQPVTGPSSLTSLVTAHPAGSTLTLTIIREGRTEKVQAATKQSAGHPVIGIEVTGQYKFPFTVKFSVGDIGGPSAGMMFALGIIDKLTADNLTGGRFIAGTGEIEPSGKVDAIGGIQQKMIAARQAGATVFLAPAANCSAVKGAIPAGLQVVKVATLSQAVTDLAAVNAGHAVPSC
jgi:PDZ domain-containing protein